MAGCGWVQVDSWEPCDHGAERERELRTWTKTALKRLRDEVKEGALRRDRSCQARTLVPSVTCGGELDPHEIIPRSAWRFGIYFLTNVIIVCRRHHDWIDDHPKEAAAVDLHGFSWERT